jgi:hypothetical protein
LGETAKHITFKELKDSVLSVPRQFRDDCRVTLLAPFVFGFGITTAMFAYFVNSTLISESSNLGVLTLGFLEAFSYFIAVISAYPYAYISNHFESGQDFVIQFGSLSFLLSGLMVLILSDKQLSTWTFILIVKMLYGFGRGVFEGSCRAVYAQMFTGRDLATAFSGQTLLAGFSGGICFFLFNELTKTSIAAITVLNGIIAIIFYFILMSIDSTHPVSWFQLIRYFYNPSQYNRNNYTIIGGCEEG